MAIALNARPAGVEGGKKSGSRVRYGGKEPQTAARARTFRHERPKVTETNAHTTSRLRSRTSRAVQLTTNPATEHCIPSPPTHGSRGASLIRVRSKPTRIHGVGGGGCASVRRLTCVVGRTCTQEQQRRSDRDENMKMLLTVERVGSVYRGLWGERTPPCHQLHLDCLLCMRSLLVLSQCMATAATPWPSSLEPRR